ncbi:PREDICTED: uncharacterized protein C2orf78-like [Chinchilla lanigera]|uniref:uncharacterized protein C2orf78-like n=1 Tax=Chinchilla lanigera TaxID=34839 RepID=UPI0006974C8A|nr:PREDICTED: uncharacterized protein C2orf78-like [Chinchilla lanigera]
MMSRDPKPLEAHPIFTGKQDAPLLSLQLAEPPELLVSTKYLIPRQADCVDALEGKSHLSPQQPGTLDKGTEYSPGWAELESLVEDIQLPQVLHSLDDSEPPEYPTALPAHNSGAMEVSGVQERAETEKVLFPQVRNNKHKASEPIAGAPEAKIQLKGNGSLSAGEGRIFNALGSDRAPADVTENSHSTSPRGASGRTNPDKGLGQARARRTKENNSRKALESKQPAPKLKAEDRPPIPNVKRKRHQPALGQEAFKKPRTCLGMHMLESVQVFHPLGKKLDKTAGTVASRALGTSNADKDPKTSQTTKPWPRAPREGKGPDSAGDTSQNLPGRAPTEGSSASLCELPPPGQVKLIPLRFPSPEKPQARPVSRRPQLLASRRPPGAYHARPAATSTALPSQPAAANTSLMGPAKPAQPVPNNASQPHSTSSTQPGLPQSAGSQPAPQETAPSASLGREPVATAVTKRRSPPQQQHPFLLEDFSRQPIPWREPNVPEPVMSSPITEEQRPEREALKRQAQRERELAANYTSLGKLQFFKQRERDREIAQYYGYAR